MRGESHSDKRTEEKIVETLPVLASEEEKGER
jgi:hypothetical protein